MLSLLRVGSRMDCWAARGGWTMVSRLGGAARSLCAAAGGSAPPPDSEVVGPGSSNPDQIATPYEQAAGRERLELLAKLAGNSAFLMEPLKVDHFGTLKDPIMVDSVVGRRIVGCTGFPKYSHEPVYFWVDGEEGPMRCNDCGQAFKINKLH